MLPVGFAHSIFARMRACPGGTTRVSSTIGVFPIAPIIMAVFTGLPEPLQHPDDNTPSPSLLDEQRSVRKDLSLHAVRPVDVFQADPRLGRARIAEFFVQS